MHMVKPFLHTPVALGRCACLWVTCGAAPLCSILPLLLATVVCAGGCAARHSCLCWWAAQVFEQLFQLYEQKLPKRAERDFRSNMFIDPQKHEYMCAPIPAACCFTTVPHSSAPEALQKHAYLLRNVSVRSGLCRCVQKTMM